MGCTQRTAVKTQLAIKKTNYLVLQTQLRFNMVLSPHHVMVINRDIYVITLTSNFNGMAFSTATTTLLGGRADLRHTGTTGRQTIWLLKINILQTLPA
jgi:hypothetical protein